VKFYRSSKAVTQRAKQTIDQLLFGLLLAKCQYADRHINCRQRARKRNSTICYRKKQIDVSFQCVYPVIDNEFRHNIVKVVCGSTRLSPRGSTATLTML